MEAELVNSATSSKLKEMDWTKNIEICEIVAHDQGYIYDFLLPAIILEYFFPSSNYPTKLSYLSQDAIGLLLLTFMELQLMHSNIGVIESADSIINLTVFCKNQSFKLS